MPSTSNEKLPQFWDWVAPISLGLIGTVFMTVPTVLGSFNVAPTLPVILGVVGLVASIALWAAAPAAEGRRGLSAVVSIGGLMLNGLLVFVVPFGDLGGTRTLVVVAVIFAAGPLSVGWLLLRGFSGRSFVWLALLVIPVIIAFTSASYNTLLIATILGPVLVLFAAAATAPAFRRAVVRKTERLIAEGQAVSDSSFTSRTNTLAILALVFAFVQGVVAVIFGHIALRQIARTHESGRGLAIAGLIVGYISIALWLLLVIFYVLVFASIA